MKEIVKITLPNSRLGKRIKQANGRTFSRRIVFPAGMPKFGNHSLLISEDFIKQDPQDPTKSILHFYADNEVRLSKTVKLANGEVVYPAVITTPHELKAAVAEKLPQSKEQTYSSEYIETLKKNVSSLEYLETNYGMTFHRTANHYFECDQHDSLIIDMRKNAIYWNSQGIKGSLIDFIMKVDHKPFMKCVQDLDRYYKELPVDKKELQLPEFEEKVFTLPDKATGMLRVKEYLCQQRGIDDLLVDKLIREERIYQDTKGNCVFVMTNSSGDAVGAFRRSTYSGFRADAAGSKKNYGFYVEICPDAKKLVITESFIDALSYITMKQRNNEKIDFNVLGSDSASTINETFRINYLSRPELNQHIDTVVLAPDNDPAGQHAIESFQEFVKPFHYITDIQLDLSEGKDWNEDLVKQREQEPELII